MRFKWHWEDLAEEEEEEEVEEGGREYTGAWKSEKLID